MKIIYIASPYSIGDVVENVKVQLDAAHKILDAGHCPIAPLLSHYLDIYRPRRRADWIKMGLALVPCCDIVLRLPGESAGADGEVTCADLHSIPVAFDWNELWDLLENCKNLPRQTDDF